MKRFSLYFLILPFAIMGCSKEQTPTSLKELKKVFLFCTMCLFLIACQPLPIGRLTSTTYIKANDAFILGNNEHGVFSAQLKNTSDSDIKIWQSPITGGQHSPFILQPKTSVTVKVSPNTALRIENLSDKQIAIQLKVKGDTGLSMGYKN